MHDATTGTASDGSPSTAFAPRAVTALMSVNLLLRAVVVAVVVPTALAIVYVGGWVLAGFLAIFGVIGSVEVYRLAERTGIRAVSATGIALSAFLPLAGYAALAERPSLDPAWLLLSAPAWVLAVLAQALLSRRPTDRPLAAVGVTLFGALYAGGLPAFILLLRHPPTPLEPAAATGLVFLPLVLIWVCDSLAMAGGSAIGGPKLSPVVSPNKTWAGAITGSLGAVLIAPVYGWLVLARFGVDVALWHLLVYGVLVSTLGQVGDLAESLLKREAGVKDSGRFFPGHGGVLDRFDSLYWGIPVAALLSRAFGVT